MLKPWLILGLFGIRTTVILAECETLDIANRGLEIVSKKYPNACICWVESRKKYDQDKLTEPPAV